jgi:hypothetical protein
LLFFSVVRSLRQAKREAEADSFLASCSVEVGKALDESQGVGPGEDAASMVDAALEKIFDEIETKKSLDPPGFVREVMASDQEAEGKVLCCLCGLMLRKTQSL